MMTLELLSGPLAYIGPGAGMGMLVSLLGLVAAVVTALLTVAFWPIRNMLKKRRANSRQS